MENYGFLILIGISVFFTLLSIGYITCLKVKYWFNATENPIDISLAVSFIALMASLFFIPEELSLSRNILFWLIFSFPFMLSCLIQSDKFQKKDVPFEKVKLGNKEKHKQKEAYRAKWVFLYALTALGYCIMVCVFAYKAFELF